MEFDSDRSPIHRDSQQQSAFIEAVEAELPDGVNVVGVVEIGSFAKGGEAIPGSDTDTRVYVRGEDILCVMAMYAGDEPIGLAQHLAAQPQVEVHRVQFREFNGRLVERLDCRVENRVTCGLIDTDYAAFLFANLDRFPTQDHSMLFQSNVVCDKEGWVARRRTELEGDIHSSLIEMYRRQVLMRVREQLPHHADNPESRGPHQWLLKAVRSIREAITLWSYAETGRFLYRKEDVLRSVHELVPQASSLAIQLYQWKSDPRTREQILSGYRAGDPAWQLRFRDLTPEVQQFVEELAAQIPVQKA